MNIATYCRHYISISYYLYNVFTGYVNIMFISRIHNVSQVDVTSVKVSIQHWQHLLVHHGSRNCLLPSGTVAHNSSAQ